jgi:hypothetical protein
MQYRRLVFLVPAINLVLLAQTPAPTDTTQNPNVPLASGERFYPHYSLMPIGDGKEKVLLTITDAGRSTDIVVQPLIPKDGGETVQWVFYANGGGALYTKRTISLPGPTGGTPVEGIVVSSLSKSPAEVRSSAVGHQSSSKYTTPSHKDKDFKLPIRMDRAGFAARPRIWLLWDGKMEIQVEPLDTKFKDTIMTLPGFGNHIKYLSNVYTEGSPAPRFFYLQRNKDDSMTVYGNDDIEKLKAIEKGKDR